MSNPGANKAKASILVLGAAELGTAVVEALAAHPYRHDAEIAVSMRPASIINPSEPKKAQLNHLKQLNIRAIPLDIEAESQADLARAFTLYGTIIGCTGMAGSPGLQMKLAQAALEAKVLRYIPWQFGVDYDIIGPEAANGFFAAQCSIRSLLRSQSRTRWVIISTGVFMSFLFENLFGIVERQEGKTTVRALGSWENRLTATTVEDIGRCTAEVALKADEVWQGGDGNGNVVHVAGDTATFAQLAAILDRVTGATVARELWSIPILREKMEDQPENGIFKYRIIWAEGRGIAWDVNRSFNGERSIPMQNIEDWARENII